MDNMIKISELSKAFPIEDEDVFVINQFHRNTNILETRTATAEVIAKYISDSLTSLLDKLIPVGTIKMYAGDILQYDKLDGWLLCNGQYVSRVKYKRLFDLIGGIYGVSTSESFALPNFVGKIPLGYCGSNKQPIALAGVDNTVNLGDTGGAYQHTLSPSEMPVHKHTIVDPTHNHMFAADDLWPINPKTLAKYGINMVPNSNLGYDAESYSQGSRANLWTTSKSSTDITMENTGGNMPHNNVQPYLAVHYIIKY